jgi:hypothetical protein
VSKYATGGVVTSATFTISESEWVTVTPTMVPLPGRRLPPMEVPPWPTKYQAEAVARAALLECSRPDLAWYLFSYSDTEKPPTPHYDNSAASFSGIPDGYHSAPCLTDLALIERAMAIGFRSAGLRYECSACETHFRSYGVTHMTDLLRSA